VAVGFYGNQDPDMAFVLDPSAPMPVTGIPPFPGYTRNVAYSINSSGAVVGSSGTSTGGAYTPQHAFLYTVPAPQPVNLVLVAQPQWQALYAANAINDGGEIVGYGLNPQGETHGYLLTPLPSTNTGDPSGTALRAALGLVAEAEPGYQDGRGDLSNLLSPDDRRVPSTPGQPPSDLAGSSSRPLTADATPPLLARYGGDTARVDREAEQLGADVASDVGASVWDWI
jgi:hypothetical protein